MTIKEKEIAQKDLERIELDMGTWESTFAYEMEVWEEIAANINSTTGNNQKHWLNVMDLYNLKYKNNLIKN